jgi:hypothetical protein
MSRNNNILPQRVTTGLQRALEQGESLETPLKIEPFVGFEAD